MINKIINTLTGAGKLAIVSVILIVVAVNTIGINSAGQRTVIQLPTGTLKVKFAAGPYTQWFGSTTIYNDVMTLDFDKTESGSGATIDQNGISVRYQDGGTGSVYGITRLRLPSDEKTMLAIHKEFRSNKGLAFKLAKTITEETMNHTAGFMTSEESYTERGRFTEMAKKQLTMGKFQTVQKEIVTVEAGYEYCLEANLTKENKKSCNDVKRVTKIVPDIATKNGIQLHVSSDLKTYGITISGFQLVDWDYESATMKQISDKRNATMAIITAKANAERAKQDAITAESQGLANVMKAKYEKEVEKERAVVVAEQTAEVAVIAAKQKVDVAAQQKLEEEQKKLAAYETKKQQIALGQGEAERKRLVMEADGALEMKVNAWKAATIAGYKEFGKQKWVSEITMGGSGSGEGTGGNSAAVDLMNLMKVNNARELSLDMSMKGKTSK